MRILLLALLTMHGVNDDVTTRVEGAGWEGGGETHTRDGGGGKKVGEGRGVMSATLGTDAVLRKSLSVGYLSY